MSLQVCIPCGCPNKCKFCVSRMDENTYPNRIEKHSDEYCKRLQYAREGHQTMVITGTGEPLTNPDFLGRLDLYNGFLKPAPFKWVEIQTSGIYLWNHWDLLKSIGVSTINLSVSHIFDSRKNAEIMGIHDETYYDLEDLCDEIKKHGFNLRLSLNLWGAYNAFVPELILGRAKELKADQVTFKILYSLDNDTPQAKWIKENPYTDMDLLIDYITSKGLELETLSFGATRYDIKGMSVVLDHNCMQPQYIRYLVLRTDCHLYTRWDSHGSLLF